MAASRSTADVVVVSFLRDLVFYAASRGADAQALCKRAGVTPTMLATPDEMVSGHIAGALWAAAVEATRDPDLGLHLGEASHLSSLGLVAPVLLNCPNLRRALGKFADYSRLLWSSFAIEIADLDARRSAVQYLVLPHDNYVARAPRHPMECILAATVVGASQLIGRPLQIEEVHFRHPAPPSVKAHAAAFRAPIRWEQELDQLIVDHAQLDRPIVLADPSVLARHEAKAREVLSQRGQANTHVARVRQALGVLLRGDLPAIQDVAEHLHMSARSLQRALADEGESFRALLDDVRKELALAHLKDPNTAVAQIALLLGFSEASAFHRSFKRWTGATPSQYRGAS
jgi:AraC-like DNA-binding protein